MDNPQVLATVPANPLISGDPGFDNLPVSHRILLNPQLLQSVQNTAEILSKAKGYVSNDLLNQTQTCFAVCVTAFETGLNPFFLAQGAFQTPEGKVGFDTRRIQAVVESKNLFSKAPKAEYSGPWDKLVGKFKKEESGNSGPNGRKKWKTIKTWTAQDAKGCKLKITYYFRDRDDPEEFEMDLAEVGTFFSTSWATEPKNQFYNLVFRRGLNQKRASALAGTPAYEDLLAEEAPLKEVNERPNKDGNAGLAGFAEPPTTDVVVEESPDPDASAASKEEPTTAKETASEPETADDQDKPLTIWISADEPARPMKSISNAAYVLRHEIKDAKTGAQAQAVFDNNIGVISQAGTDASNNIEQELNLRLEKGDGDAGDDDSQPSHARTVWLGPDEPAREYSNEGNAVHLMQTAIKKAKTAAVAKTIRDQNAELIDSMPGIAERLDFAVSKRFEEKTQGSKTLL